MEKIRNMTNSKATGTQLMVAGVIVLALLGFIYLWLVPVIIKFLLGIWGIIIPLIKVQTTMACIYGLYLALKPNKKGDK